MWEDDYDYSYTPVAERREDARRALEKLRREKPDVRPVTVTGSKVAKTWWGRAWVKNLEAYADYANRISRGRSYVRNGYVLDLQIEPGQVSAIVAGSRSDPYTVEVDIDGLSDAKWRRITELCGRSVANIDQLVRGEFPQALESLFTQRGKGLFPTPREIRFSCSCPDWAHMCKHVAAVLYGIGARLDEEPLLFFELRGIEIEALIKKSVEEKMESLLKNADNKTPRVMEDADIGALFGL